MVAVLLAGACSSEPDNADPADYIAYPTSRVELRDEVLARRLASPSDGAARAAREAPTGPPTSLAEVSDRLLAAAPFAGFLRAEVTRKGRCRPVAGLERDRPLPVASVFKLYVLGAVVDAIEDGRLDWGTRLMIRDELASLPAGITQDEPHGSRLSVRELARRMIQLSDNTATDHLIDVVGRRAVEQAVVDMGHSAPSLLRPLLTTRDLFVLKSNPELMQRYVAADKAGRRRMLLDEVREAPLPARDDLWREPREITEVEWLASPTDVCAAMAAVAKMADTPGLEIVGAIMSTDVRSRFGSGTFDTVLHKNGREPGVLFDAWLAVRPDGKRIVMVGGVADDRHVVDQGVSELIRLGLTLEPVRPDDAAW